MAEKENRPTPQKRNKPRFSFYWIYAVLAIVFIALNYFNYTSPTKEISWPKLEQILEKQHVDKIVIINKEKAEIYIKKDTIKADTAYKDFEKKTFGTGDAPQYFYQIGSEEIFNGLLKDTRDSIVSRMNRDSIPSAPDGRCCCSFVILPSLTCLSQTPTCLCDTRR